MTDNSYQHTFDLTGLEKYMFFQEAQLHLFHQYSQAAFCENLWVNMCAKWLETR